MQVLLRKKTAPLYLQPSGEWTDCRATARVFGTTLLAYCWAKEEQLLDAVILLAFAYPQKDIVLFALRYWNAT
jgi:hypothetical protein